jgi:hypothetical protein
VLFNELFKTIYPNESGYIVAVTPNLSEDITSNPIYEERIKTLVPLLQIDDPEDECIYLVEDSHIDLGILVSIERNFQRILEIITDYLDWYLDAERKKLDGENSGESEEKVHDSAEEYNIASDKIFASGAAASDVDGEDEELVDNEKPYNVTIKMVEYLTYGYETEPEWLDLKSILEYLMEHRFHDSNLHNTRKKPREFDDGSGYNPNQPGIHYCDFCGNVLESGKYDILKDGRERCPLCSSDAVKSRKQFKQIYVETLEELERIFDIKIEVPIKVRMASAKKVNDIPNAKWEPTPGFDGRVLGFAEKSSKGYRLLVENGAPKWKMKSTLAHELTHIWQYENWSDEKINKTFKNQDEILLNMEGMAVWTEIQYLVSMGEKEKAVRYKRNRDADSSVYGTGMKKFIAKYPIKEVSGMKNHKTPFKKFPPLK